MPFLVLILVHVVVFHMIAVPLFLCGIDEDRAVQLGAIGFAVLPVMLTVWLTGRWSDRAGLTSRVRLVACLSLLLFSFFVFFRTIVSSHNGGLSVVCGIGLPLHLVFAPLLVLDGRRSTGINSCSRCYQPWC
jgi:hypothetical protein